MDEQNIVPQLSTVGVYQTIKDIIQVLLACSENLHYQSKNNMVESFNSVIAEYITFIECIKCIEFVSAEEDDTS